MVLRATQTDIWGIEREIIEERQVEQTMKVPTFEQEIQVQFGKIETLEQNTETGELIPLYWSETIYEYFIH
jgi:hypothetical protein